MTPPVSTPIHDIDDVPAASSARPMTLALPFDPILLLAVIGLCVASLITISGATVDDIAGDSHYYVNRQAVYFMVGAALAVALARVDYSRLRGAKYVVYGLLIASIVAVSTLGSVARGSRRAIDLGFFTFQASELGKVLLIV
ncbi:MAG: FtsW/RodA/SpoVE family cell cycle protein, partial [Solirubrobacteraceae bacterium]